MSISLLLEMAASSDADRIAVVSGDLRLSTGELSVLADGAAGVIAASGASQVVYVGTGGALLPLLLFTSGTTSRPKAVELTHDNLTSYVTGTVEFSSSDPAEAALICVPPYHIAGLSAAMSNLYAGAKDGVPA